MFLTHTLYCDTFKFLLFNGKILNCISLMTPEFVSSVNNLVPFLMSIGLFVFFLLIFGSPLSIQDIISSLMIWGAVFFFKSIICLEPRSPALQVDSLPAELQGKPENTGVDSLSLLQWIFPTQELNWDLLHCRQILYELSYQGSPNFVCGVFN